MSENRLENLNRETQMWCSIVMFSVSVLTLAKVIKSTRRDAKHYRLLYVILSLSVASWLVVLLTYIFKNSLEI
jgi:hypothetical protein